MRIGITSKLLKVLEKHAGQKISLKEIQKALEPPPGRSGERTKRKSRFSRSPGHAADLQEIRMVIAELELLGLVELQGSKLSISHPFFATGKVSMNPRGLIFISPRGADPAALDLFVPPQESKGAFPGDTVLVRLKDRSRDRFEGKIVSIVKRGRTHFRMKLLEKPEKGGIPGTLLDMQAKIPVLLRTDRIPRDMLDRMRPDQVLVVHLTGEETRFKGAYFRLAEFVRFEEDSDMDSDYERVLMKYNLNPVYPSSIHLPDSTTNVDEKTVPDWKSRKDLRDLFTITIDGADSKDFDDAISLEVKSKKLWKLYVHIADVSHYVKPGSPLDNEARERATSVYLVNRVVPMLPPVLSENLCSLVAGRNRLAFTAEMDVNPRTGEILKSSFYKSVILVDRRLTYEIAEDEIDRDIQDRKRGREPSLLGLMWDLAITQKGHRIKSGRIDLNIPEPKIKMGKNDQVDSFSYRDRLKSSMLIEEFMLSANQETARFLRKKKAKTLYRVHETMDETKLERLNSFFEIYNVPFVLKDASHRSITRAMEAVKQHPRSESVEKIFNMLLLRSFMQATYRGDPLGHWGLGFDDYCHFTSPIRRYPDLVVHRALEHAILKKRPSYTEEEIHELGIHTSEQERKAMEAERDMQRLKVIRYIERLQKKNFRGFLTGFKTDRVFLELEDLPAEGVVAARHLTNDSELILPDSFSVYVKRLSRPAFLGEVWNLELDRIDPEEIRIYFKPLWGKESRAPFR